MVTMLGALTQREFREFGAAATSGSDDGTPGLVGETASVGDAGYAGER